MKLDYIDVVQTINRLCDVLGADWDWRVLESRVEVIDLDGPKFLASERGELAVYLPDRERPVVRGGAGADLDSRDPDKAIKTADAEALKKAGHKFQIALYLWDEEKRNEIAEYRQLAKGSVAGLKTAVAQKAGTSDVNEIASIFEVDVDSLQERDVLLSILSR